MINGELIQRVQSLYSRGVQSDDSRLSSRHIYNKLITTRAKLFSQKIRKKQFIGQWNYEVLPCVEMIKVPVHECPCIPPLGCFILRSKYKLPEPLESLSRHMIQYVSNLTGTIRIDETQFENVKYKKGNRYTSDKTEYFIREGYLYIVTSQEGFEVVTISGLFQDSEAVSNFPSYCDDKCADCEEEDCLSMFDKDFTIDLDMVDTLVTMAVEELLLYPLQAQAREDATTDTRDNIPQESK